MELKNEQLSQPVGTKGFHVPGYNGIDKLDWIVLEEDCCPPQHKLFARHFGDLATFGKREISKEFNLLDKMRNAVERSAGRSRSHKPYPGIVSTVGSIRFSDSGPVRWLPSSRGNPSFGNGWQQRRKRYETGIDCHTKSASYTLRTMLGSRVPRLRLPEAETTRNSRSCQKNDLSRTTTCAGADSGGYSLRHKLGRRRVSSIPSLGGRLQAARDGVYFATNRTG